MRRFIKFLAIGMALLVIFFLGRKVCCSRKKMQPIIECRILDDSSQDNEFGPGFIMPLDFEEVP